MKNDKYKNIRKKDMIRLAVLGLLLAFFIYVVYTIYNLIKQPTNIFVVENGTLTMEEEAIRLRNKRRDRSARRKL